MKYEVGNELISEGYVMRTDSLGKLQFGTLANILERYTEARFWPKILNGLFAEGTYHACNGSIFDLIAWKWKDEHANKTAWDEFQTKINAGRAAYWCTDGGIYSKMNVQPDSMLA